MSFNSCPKKKKKSLGSRHNSAKVNTKSSETKYEEKKKSIEIFFFEGEISIDDRRKM